jgi:hypothetical protein
MPYLSIILPTNRMGGLDIVFDGLSKQTFKDFELVLSDAFYEQRKNIVSLKAEQYNIKIIHCKPFELEEYFPISAYCRFANTGLAYASGEIVVMITDYTWLPFDCLEKHTKFHKQNKNLGLMCPHQYYLLPKLHSNFPKYKNEDIQKYVSNVVDGTLDPFQYSIFEKNFDSKNFDWQLHPTMKGADPKLTMQNAEITYGYFHCKNESLPLEAAIKCKGFNERMDGTNCYMDTCFADRAVVRGGLKTFILDNSNVARLINARDIFPFPIRLREHQDNLRIWRKIRDDHLDEINSWKLEEVRDIIQRQRKVDEDLKKIEFKFFEGY